MRTLLKPLSFIPALLLMYMIFSFSGQVGETSSDLSFRVSCKIVSIGNDILGTDLTPDRIEHYASKIHGFVRKLAHMTEYFALAVAVAFPLYVYGLRGILLMLIAGAFCVAFACGDEFHQSFVSGRSPSKRDVLIDSIGIFCGIILVRMVGWTGRMTIFRKKETSAAAEQMPGWGAPPPYPPQSNGNMKATPFPSGQPQTNQQMPPPGPQSGESSQNRQPYSAGLNQKKFQNTWDEEYEYEDEEDLDEGKPLRLFHYDDEYEEEEVEENDETLNALKAKFSSLKKHKHE